MDYILLFVQVLCAGGMTLCAKEFSRTYMKSLANYFIFNFFAYTVLVFIMMLFKPDFSNLSIYTIILAPCMAVSYILTMLMLYRAMDRGLLAYTTLIFSFGVIVPMVFGILLWNETVSIMQIAGLILLFVTFYIGSLGGSGGISNSERSSDRSGSGSNSSNSGSSNSCSSDSHSSHSSNSGSSGSSNICGSGSNSGSQNNESVTAGIGIDNRIPIKKFDVVWLLLCIGALLANGSVMTVAKAHQMILPQQQVKEFVILVFGIISVLSAIMFLILRMKTKESFNHLRNKRFAMICITQGALTAICTFLGVTLAASIPAVIQFPTVNGGVVMLTSIFSIVIFKERLNRKTIIGLILGFIALVFISGLIR